MTVNAKKLKPVAIVESIIINYNGREVNAKKLTVHSTISMPINVAWNNVKTPALLQFVAKGMIQFESVGCPFPKQWEEGKTYGAKMYIFGFIPFGGTHYLTIEKIDDANFKIATKEWDKGAKVWNHEVTLKDLGNGSIFYEDAITIYGGIMTSLITYFGELFYRHRQKRWQLIAQNNLMFGS